MERQVRPKDRRGRLAVALWLDLCLALAFAGGAAAQDEPWRNSFGLPGLIDMPTGAPMPRDALALTLSTYSGEFRGALAFQVTPRLTGVFRYLGLPGAADPYYDRSFDLRYQISSGANGGPAIAVGLMDFGGTGIYSSEYVVATQTLGPALEMTGGIAWGRMASRGGFDNPLSVLGSYFDTRPGFSGDINDTGRVEIDRFFRGDAALFGGLRWTPRDDLSFAVEYSSDTYDFENRRLGFVQESPVNLSASYRLPSGGHVSGAWLYGNEFSLTYSRIFYPGNLPAPGGRAPAPPPLQQRRSAAELGWILPAGAGAGQAPASLERQLSDLGLHSLGLTIAGSTATLRLDNPTYHTASEAIGRAARVMANALPAEVETIEIVPVVAGLPVSRIRLERSDLEALEHQYDGNWTSFARAGIADAWDLWVPQGTGLRFLVAPYVATAYFDPDAPLRADLGIGVSASWSPGAGLIFSGQLRQPLIGNLDEWERRSNSVLPHVRSDAVLYDVNTDTELTWLTAEKFFRPGPDLYGRVTAGLLERMYGGVSAELLWAPQASRAAYGAEINYARQRDFDSFGFRDYEVITGHGSVYYDMGNGYFGQVDVGRYLAGDWGATFSLDRRFDNGARIGAFFTLTDVPFDQFGEGSFDKGIVIEIPIGNITGQPTRETLSQVIRPILRDGGARLDVRNRLYDLTDEYRQAELSQSWGRFWR